VKLELEVKALGGGELIEVCLLNPEHRELCGLSVGISYDQDSVSFLSAEGCEDFCGADGFSFTDVGGCVRILIDKSENGTSERLAALRFLPKETHSSQNVKFELIASKPVAACRFAGKTVEPLEILILDSDKNGSEVESARSDRNFEIEVAQNGDCALVGLTGYTFSDGFAAGFDVSVVLLATSETECFLSVAALPVSKGETYRFERNFTVPQKGNVCVIARPVIYDGQGAKYGNEKVFLIINGELCG
jgi:hypothetical protein